ncbi:ABC transporter substrate-binding protein [Cohnella silvisoli]|uniref:Extracellular solute-binding protein n=1 Tax=Cohnella silvisoli TaxID=2873699 RepID=A0ABV1L045_9BACL|nr:extracellular solute-binding protein [Cohnella silvisoli]MCD9024910.1 extracellular solute-binding protein [Cohnella silvisoli]
MSHLVRRSKSAIALVLSVMLVLLLAACGGGNKDNNAASSGSSSPSASPSASEGSASGEQVTIKYWTWVPSADDYKPIIEAFEKSHPMIKVDLTVMSSLDYQQKLPISLSTGEELDVVGVQPNMVKQLQPYLEETDGLMKQYVSDDWQSQFDPTSITQAKKLSDPMVMVPVGSTGASFLYYNNKMLQDLGLQAPKSYDDLKNIVKTVKEKRPGVLPLSLGGKEGWILDEIVLTLLTQKSDLFNKIRYKEGGKWDSPEYLEAVKEFKQWIDDGVISQDVIDLDYTRALETFTTGKAAMFIQGSWAASMLSSKYKSTNNIALEDIGLTAIPVMSAGGKPTVRSFLDIGMGVSKNSKHKAEAAEFVKFMTLGEGADVLGKLFVVVPSKVGFTPDLSDLNATGQESFKKMQELIASAGADRNNLGSFSSDVVGPELQRMLLTKTPPEDIAKNIQKEFDTGKYLK